jgi:hypothetical protein
MSRTTADAGLSRHVRLTRLLAIIVMVAGAVMVVAGAATWFAVQSQLADEKITVSDDAEFLAGDEVNGPFSAYAQANVIEKHALEASEGKTYAELDREDPRRETVMNASFLRASLFTSVVAFGVAAMAMGVGVLLALVGYALYLLSRQLAAHPATAGA